MTRIATKCFGEVEYAPDAAFEFPNGIPGFEDERTFILLEHARVHPLLFMQSVVHPDVCFVLLPILAADPHYNLQLGEEDLATLRLDRTRQPRIGKEVLCAAMVCAADDDRPYATTNLLAPIVMNLQERIGIQAIQTTSGYSHRHPLLPPGQQMEMALCS